MLLPLAALVIKGSSASSLAELIDDPARPARGRLLSPDVRRRAARRRVNAVFGFIVAWTLVRYDFPGRRLVDAMIDLPFALPTAVSGIALTAVFAPNGWLGQYLRAARHPGRLHLDRRRRRADADRPAVRRALGAAGADRSAARPRGRRRDARRRPLPRLPPHHPARRCCRRSLTGLHARVRARHRRIRLGGLHLRQPADEDRDHAAADRDQARAVRLRTAPRRSASSMLVDVLRDAARDQPAAGLGPRRRHVAAGR